MEHQNFPSSSISLLRFLYAHPRDIPLLNGVPSSHYIPQRGLRQGCPLSPTLFAIYLDPVLRLLNVRISTSPSSLLYAFADDLLLQSPHPAAHGRLLKTLHSDAKAWGLEINPKKTVIHAMGAAPPLTITSTTTPTFKYATPDFPTHYKYLGSYIFTTTQSTSLLPLLQNEIIGFLARLSPLHLSGPELVHLINIQLLPRLLYRGLAHPLSSTQLQLLNHWIWSCLTANSKIPKTTLCHTRHLPRSQGGLGLKHFPTYFAAHQLTYFCRYLFHQGPPHVNDAVIRALRSSPQQASTFSLRAALQTSTDTLQLSLYMPGSQPRITPFLSPSPPFQPVHVEQEHSSLVLHPPHPPHKFEDIRPQLENTSYIIAFTDGSLQEQRAGCAVLMHRTQHHSNTQIPNTEQGPPPFSMAVHF